MELLMNVNLTELGIMIAIIISLGQVIKKTGKVSAKYLPVINVIFGILAGVFYMGGDTKESILAGIVIGLSASGSFDLVKFRK